MALINEKPVNAELFKVDDRILTLGVVEFFELRLDCLSGFHQLFDRELYLFRFWTIFVDDFAQYGGGREFTIRIEHADEALGDGS